MLTIRKINWFCEPGPRSNQEDRLSPSNPSADERVFVLCDGMGGHGHGEIASAIVAETVYSYLKGLKCDEYKASDLQTAVDCAVEALARQNHFDDDKVMGTTIVIVAINSNDVIVGHAGDSRAYLFSSDGLKIFRTRDHSMVADAVENEFITEEQAFNSPMKNIVTRCILADGRPVELEIDTLHPADGEMLMICTDGVSDALRDSEIEQIITSFDFDPAGEMLRTGVAAKTSDNNTALAICFDQDEILARQTEMRPADSVTKEGFSEKFGTEAVGEQKKYEEPELIADDVSVRTCGNCGMPNSADSNFCRFCGVPFGEKNENRPSIVQRFKSIFRRRK